MDWAEMGVANNMTTSFHSLVGSSCPPSPRSRDWPHKQQRKVAMASGMAALGMEPVEMGAARAMELEWVLALARVVAMEMARDRRRWVGLVQI